MKKKILSGALFVALVLLMVAVFNEAFRPVRINTVLNLQTVTEQTDVIVLGPSTTLRSFSPAQLFENTGIAGYNMSAPGLDSVTAYFYLQEALKEQNPKLVILSSMTETSNLSSYRHNNVDPLPLDKEKLEFIGALPQDQRWSFLFTFDIYHNRWSTLASEWASPVRRPDLLPHPISYAAPQLYGGGICARVVSAVDRNLENNGDELTYSAIEEQTEYIRRAIELCRKNDIEVLFATSCILGSRYNGMVPQNAAMMQAAAEAGAQVLDMANLIDEIGLDPSQDYADEAHVNDRGAQKYTKYLGDYLTQHYDLPDHRGDPAYQGYVTAREWEKRQVTKNALCAETDVDAYLDTLAGAQMTTCVLDMASSYPNSQAYVDKVFETLGVSIEGEGRARMALVENGATEKSHVGDIDKPMRIALDDNCMVKKAKASLRLYSDYEDEKKFSLVDDTIMLVVYDANAQTWVDVVTIHPHTGTLEHLALYPEEEGE